MHPDVLNSWKDIADYLGRGVRTVQRWERELSLPVHRPRAKLRSAVMASRSELDAWLHVRSHLMDPPSRKAEIIALLHSRRNKAREQWAQLRKNLQKTQQLVESLATTAQKKRH